jgi:hypothetical protein
MIRLSVSTQRGTTRESRTMSSHFGDYSDLGDAPWPAGPISVSILSSCIE